MSERFSDDVDNWPAGRCRAFSDQQWLMCELRWTTEDCACADAAVAAPIDGEDRVSAICTSDCPASDRAETENFVLHVTVWQRPKRDWSLIHPVPLIIALPLPLPLSLYPTVSVRVSWLCKVPLQRSRSVTLIFSFLIIITIIIMVAISHLRYR